MEWGCKVKNKSSEKHGSLSTNSTMFRSMSLIFNHVQKYVFNLCCNSPNVLSPLSLRELLMQRVFCSDWKIIQWYKIHLHVGSHSKTIYWSPYPEINKYLFLYVGKKNIVTSTAVVEYGDVCPPWGFKEALSKLPCVYNPVATWIFG